MFIHTKSQLTSRRKQNYSCTFIKLDSACKNFVLKSTLYINKIFLMYQCLLNQFEINACTTLGLFSNDLDGKVCTKFRMNF